MQLQHLLSCHKHRNNQLTPRFFSYLGNQNNPPDMIIKNSDAFEIKKIETAFASCFKQFSAKNKLRAGDIRITEACRNCENLAWKEKGFILCCRQC